MSMNGLKQFITNVRQSKDIDEESNKLKKEFNHIFNQFKSHDNQLLTNYNIRKYICKLIYIQLVGYNYTDNSNSDSFNKIGIDQCLKLINSRLSNDDDNNSNDKLDIDSNLNNWNNNKEIGFLGIKSLFNESISIENFQLIINSVLIDINLINYEKNEKILNSIWINISIGLQSIGDLIIWIKNLQFPNSFFNEFINSILNLLINKTIKIPEFIKIRIILCLTKFINLNNKQIKLNILTIKNLKIISNLFSQLNLNNKNLIISICLLFKNWLIFDWENILNIEGLLITKLNELIDIIENNNWIEQYGLMIISLFDILSQITTISNNGNPRLKLIVDKLILNCINNLNNDLQIQNINISILFSSLQLYINNINDFGMIEKDDISKYIESIIQYLKLNYNFIDNNIKILCLKKINKIMLKSNNYGNSEKIIFDEIIIWKKFIHDKNLKICELTFEILFKNLEKCDKNKNILEIKEILIFLIYYLQKCDNNKRSLILLKIIELIEKFKDLKIIEEIFKKLLKIYLIIGNCNERSFIKIFELIKYLTKENLNFKKKIIEFIINGLRIGCCENFIKLSSLIFKLNCDDGKNWNIGNFEIQLSLIIDKYENSLLLTKLLILDTMNSYYKILNDEKIKNMIKLAFKQEIKCNNIEIKQRSFEYYNLINLNIEIDNEITIKNILKLPNLLINNKIQLSKNWEDGYIRLLRFDQGIFFNNEKIKILFRIKRFKGYSVIEFNYKLMNDDDIKGFKFNLINNKNEFYDIKIIEYNDKDKNGNLIIKYSLKEMYSINDEPIIQIYIPSINEYINLKLSLALKSLYINDVNGNNNSNNKMSIQTFQSRWNQIGKFMFSTGCYKNEISNPVNIDNEGLSHTVELIVRILKKMCFEIITADMDTVSNDFKIVFASILNREEGSAIGILGVLTSAAVEVRCTGAGVARGVCDRVLVVLDS